MDKNGPIVLVAPSAQPTLLRARYLHRVVDQLNRNTVALRQPRQVDPEDVNARPESKIALATDETGAQNDETLAEDELDTESWIELSRFTSTVRVENPEDATQYVDVERMDGVVFNKPDGSRVKLIFTN